MQYLQVVVDQVDQLIIFTLLEAAVEVVIEVVETNQ